MCAIHKMKSSAIIYVPSDTPEAMALAPQKVASVPLIIRSVLNLAEAGINSCILITADSQRTRIEQFLSRYKESRLPNIEFITYEEPYRVSPDMVRAIAERMDRRTLLINTNLLFDSQLVNTIYRHDPNTKKIFICQEGVHPLPIMEITREAWKGLIQFTTDLPHSIESCLKFLLENNPHKEIQKPATVNSFLLKRREDIPVAEKFLAENIRRSTNGVVAKYINKRLSLPMSMIMAKLWVSPHAITSINIVIGLLGGVFLAGVGYHSMLIGAILFQTASVVDGVDGEVAKLTFRSSKFGQYIDTISDNLALASVLIGLTVGSYRTLQSISVFIAGGIAILGILIIIATMARFLKRNTNSASLVTFDKEYLQKRSSSENPVVMAFLRYCKHFAKKDIFTFIVLVLALSGLIQYWIFFVALGGVLGSASLIYLEVSDSRKARRSREEGVEMNRSKKKMVVFDFDGTLVNSMDAFADIAADVMPRHYGIDANEARQCYLQTSGIPFFQQLETLFPGHPNNAKAADEFESIKKKSYFERPIFDDVMNTIEELHKRNIKVAVSSNNFQELVEQYIDRTGLKFDMVLGYKDNFAKGEDHFRHIEENQGITREQMAFVGDSIKDGERAASSGVSFIGKEGIFSTDDFGKHFPDSPVVKSLEELKKIL